MRQLEIIPEKTDAVAVLDPQLETIVKNSGISKANDHAMTFAPFNAAVTEYSKKLDGLNKENPSALDAKIARECRLALVKNRTATEKQKDLSKSSLSIELNLIQDLHNVVVNRSKLLEADFSAIEKFAENKAAEEAKQLAQTRLDQLQPYGFQYSTGFDLGNMNEESFQALLTGCIATHEAKVAAEKKAAIEKEAKEKAEAILTQRRIDIAPLLHFADLTTPLTVETTQEQFEVMLNAAKEKKADYDKEQETIRQENARLKLIADQNNAAQKAQDDLQASRLNLVLPYVQYGPLVDVNALWVLTEEGFNDILIQKKDAFVIDEAVKKEEKLKNDQIAADLAANVAAEAKRKQDEEDALQATLTATDAEKFDMLIADLTALKTKYTFESKKYITLQQSINVSLNRAIGLGGSML